MMNTGPARFRRLRWYNAIMGLVHAAQGVAILALSNDFALPVTAAIMEGPPGTPASTEELFTLPLGPAVAAFLFLSAIAHFVVAGPGWGKYGRDLSAHRNEQRWIEYSLSSSLMIVLIAMITGIADVAALVALFGVNAAMILFGWLQERYEEPGSGRWWPFVFGCIAGIVPWVAIGIYLIGPDGTFGIAGGDHDRWVPLHSSIDGWVEALALAYAAVDVADTVTRLTGSAVDQLDLTAMQPVAEVGGITNRWWYRPGLLAARAWHRHRGRTARGRDAGGCRRGRRPLQRPGSESGRPPAPPARRSVRSHGR